MAPVHMSLFLWFTDLVSEYCPLQSGITSITNPCSLGYIYVFKWYHLIRGLLLLVLWLINGSTICLVVILNMMGWMNLSVILVLALPRHGKEPGGCFNIKMSSYQYRKSHCGDKTVARSSYLLNGNFYTGKTYLYWTRALAAHFNCSVHSCAR